MTFRKLALIIMLLSAALILLTYSVFCQDTIPVKKVLVANALLNRKTGKAVRVWYRKVTVKNGYIVKLPNGLFIINDRVMTPDNFSYTEGYVKSDKKNKP